MTVSYLICCVGAFFLGAIPFGFLAGKMRGIDIREHGSKNIGATNTLRVLGKKAGITVLILDTLKGYLPVLVAQRLPLSFAALEAGAAGMSPQTAAGWTVAVGLCAVLGHTYSPYVRFRGGKGVATSLGVLIGLSPLIALACFAAFFLVVWATRYVSLGSIIGAVVQATLFWILPDQPLASRIFGTVAAVFVIVRHRANISRLLAGTENKFGQKAAPETAVNKEEVPEKAN